MFAHKDIMEDLNIDDSFEGRYQKIMEDFLVAGFLACNGGMRIRILCSILMEN